MKELSVLDSFIVRIYRIDMENSRNINGLVEVMDGSRERKPFSDLDELGAILNPHDGKIQKGRKKYTKNVTP
jgi:hypothetical protein